MFVCFEKKKKSLGKQNLFQTIPAEYHLQIWGGFFLRINDWGFDSERISS